MKRKLTVLIGLMTIGAGVGIFYYFGRSIWVPFTQKFTGKRTVGDVVRDYGAAADERLAPYFERAGAQYPPAKITLIGVKDERRLELWAHDQGRWRHVRDYQVTAASGRPGPKLQEGDWQVPEGSYLIEGLNPNSSYHLSLKLNYPNEFDRRQAQADGRTNLGGDIFIHGKAVSVGCLAIGDEAIEELFVLVDRIGKGNASVLIAPYDLRTRQAAKESGDPVWLDELYTDLTRQLNHYPRN